MKRILSDRDLAVILSSIDHELAEKHRRGGCPHCGGVLHSARYPRQVRCGGAVPADWSHRLSFCCAREGCRRRATPPSVRFAKRCLYPLVVIVLIGALAHGVTAARCRVLKAALGVDRRTIERWREWWEGAFAKSAFWKNARARFVQTPRKRLARFLVERFGRTGIVALLRFLAPVST